MRNIFLAIIVLLLSNQSFAETKTYDYKIESESVPEIYLRENVYSVKHVFTTSSQVNKEEIVVDTNNIDLQSTFSLSALEKGDRILLDTEQQKTFKVIIDTTPKKDNFLWFKKYFNDYRQEKEEILYPCILFTHKANEKKYGFVSKKNLELLQEINNEKLVTVERLLNYETSTKLTVVYVILPKDRTQQGYLVVKHNGKWIKDENGQRLSFKVLGRSKVNEEQEQNYRIYKESDTPQGIYLVNGVMHHSISPAFGEGPYLDIDNIVSSPGRYSYQYDRFLYESLLPIEANNDYWANEFNLSQSLGRYAIRVHSNDTDQLKKLGKLNSEVLLPTAGCLNLGSDKEGFMKLLSELAAVNLNDYPYEFTFSNKDVFSWNISDKIGLVYFIVKDED